jgi:hypothetical protein
MIASLFRLGFLRIWRRKRGRQTAHPQQELVATPSFFLQDEEDDFYKVSRSDKENKQWASVINHAGNRQRSKAERGAWYE